MKVLVVGSGGREHALAWKLSQSPLATQVFVAPGNAGTAGEAGIDNVEIGAEDIDALLDFALKQQIDLTVVGPEVPLVNGIVDRFTEHALPIFGPSAKAAQLEGSKAFSKDFLQRHQIPTAAYASFTEVEPALEYLSQQALPIVIKADGLAAGKGVVIAQTEQEAIATVNDMLSDNKFGDAGARIVIEEFLQGEEASFICMIDGEQVLPMASSQDHKARDDGDTGPNTGGMGAYSPAPVVDAALHQRILDQVINPTVKGMLSEDAYFRGFLYAGVMVQADGTPKVLEFNVRFGDPETQPIMMRLKSDLLALCLAAIDGTLNQQQAEWDERASLGVVLAAGGYPEAYEKGMVINGLAQDMPNTKVFHAGTKTDADGNVVTNGGRVLCVVGLGDSVTQAQTAAYQRAESVQWTNRYARTDIGHRAVTREQMS